jgi:hypothetical protein
MAQENIKLTKTIYSTKSTDGIIDRSFSEFFKTKDPVNLDRFFAIYGELFYDIPKTGDKSHTSVIRQSTDYIKNYIDPRDEQIDLLTDRIVELELLINKPIEEHPFYSNGTLISLDVNNNGNPDDDNAHYMDKGVKRRIMGGSTGDVFIALKASLGYPNSATDGDMVKIVPQSVFNSITSGPQLGIEDLSGQTAAEELEQQSNLLSDITISDWKEELKSLMESYNNGTPHKFKLKLLTKIRSEFEREGNMESLSYKYYLDATQGFTQEDKDNGRVLLGIVNPKLLKSRQTLAILKRIWDTRDSSSALNLYNILPKNIDSNGGLMLDKDGNPYTQNPLTEAEVEVFSGWNHGRDLFEGAFEL